MIKLETRKEIDVNASRLLPGLIAISLLVSPAALAAQRAIGFKGGVIYANASFDDAFGSEARAGSIAGGFISFPIASRTSVQVEAMYTTRGFKTIGFLQEGAAARTPFMEIPILFKFRLIRGTSRVRPSVLAGPYYGFELTCSTEGSIVEVEGSNSCDGRFRNRGTADVGIVFGGNVDLDVSDRFFVVVDGRYHHGLRNLHLDPESDGARSRAWSVIGGFGFRLGM